jgi:HAD superfamily hydrolase (TIGR01509 family)
MTGLAIFDLDGVLIDSEVIASNVVARAMLIRGIAISAEDVVTRYTGRQARDIVTLITQDHRIRFPDGFADELEGMILAELLVGLKPVRGMLDLLAQLTGMPWCVASNSGEARIRRCLKVSGLIPAFAPRLFSADKVARGKPAPDVYLHAAQEMSAAPGDCLVIEDTVTGVSAGKAAGMTVAGFLGGAHCLAADHGVRLQQAGADFIVPDSAALGRLIASLRRREMAARLPLA